MPRALSLLAVVFMAAASLFAAELRLPGVNAVAGGEAEIPIELRGAPALQHIEAVVYFPHEVSFCFITGSHEFSRAFATSVPGGARLVIDARRGETLPEGEVARITVAISGAATANELLITLERASGIDAGLTARTLRPAISVVTLTGVTGVPEGRRRAVRISKPKTSNEKIDEALRTGRIDSETALIYTLFTDFDDPRLPWEYHGADALVREGFSLIEAGEKFDSFSPAAQQIIAPFLVPAFYEGSWWDLRHHPKKGASAIRPNTGFGPVCDASIWSPFWSFLGDDKVRVWYETLGSGDAGIALEVFTALRPKIWAKVTGYIGSEPPSDNGSIEKCRGGSDALDIIVMDQRSGTDPYPKSGSNATAGVPVYIHVEKNGFQDPTRLAAHELMHALQFQNSHDLTEYRWLFEGMAEWTMDYVYGKARPASGKEDEHETASRMLGDFGGANGYGPGLPLDYHDPSYPKECDHGYGTWLLPLFVAHKYGDSNLAQRILSTIPKLASVPAVEAALSPHGGLAKVWPDFALSNWNDEPVEDLKTWDDIDLKVSHAAAFSGAFPVKGFAPRDVTAADTEIKLEETELEHLSAKYYRFSFSDPNVRTVTFWNGFTHEVKSQTADYAGENVSVYGTKPLTADERKGIFVRALYKVEGNKTWVVTDITNSPVEAFCRDEKAGRLTDLVLIVSNSDTDKNRTFKPKGLGPRLVASRVGCYQYTGEASVTLTNTEYGGSIKTTAKDLSWRRIVSMRSAAAASVNEAALYFELTGGKVSEETSGRFTQDCTHTGSGAGVAPHPKSFLAMPNFILGSSPLHGTYFGDGWSDVKYSVTSSCPPPAGSSTQEVGVQHWFNTAPVSLRPDGSLVGETTEVLSGEVIVSSWNFKPKRE